MEGVRDAVRYLIKFIERPVRIIYYTDFADNIISQKEGEALHISNDLKNYKKKVEF